jgi:hypothetical protein
MILVISGHQRSGTTMLRGLCDSHPQMRVANEFGCFADLGLPWRQAAAARLAQWRLVNGRWAFDADFNNDPRRHRRNFTFTTRYLWQLARAGERNVGVTGIAAALQQQWPEMPVVGDKLPQYMPLLSEILPHEAVKVLLIHRDARDVTSSFLEKVRTVWKERPWAPAVDTAEKIARNWVAHMKLTRQLQEQFPPYKIHVMQYENLVRDAESSITALAQWLDLPAAGFRQQRVHAKSIGKYRQGLTATEISQVMRITEATMADWGYES